MTRMRSQVFPLAPESVWSLGNSVQEGALLDGLGAPRSPGLSGEARHHWPIRRQVCEKGLGPRQVELEPLCPTQTSAGLTAVTGEFAACRSQGHGRPRGPDCSPEGVWESAPSVRAQLRRSSCPWCSDRALRGAPIRGAPFQLFLWSG